jgi:deoxyadenosine/deoxycytidine kinase
LFSIIHAALPKPELLVFLHRSVPRLIENISLRGRDYERDITPAYLQRIQDSYFDFFRSRPGIPILVIDCDGLDFVHREQDYQHVKNLVSLTYPPGLNYSTPVP